MLDKLHARLGDFWWYSLMLFCAYRAADTLNAFVGLWLVPKYVDPSELGAVMPLTNFAGFLAIPVIAFANTFRNELTRLSIGHEFGKLKTLMRSVFAATAILLLLAIILAKLVLPVFLERIRIVEGSLGIIIVFSAFVSAVVPIYTNALQSLKKFNSQSLLSIISAPVRLITMLVAMPFRALTGYFIGQASVPVSLIIGAVFSLHKELSVPAKPYWDRKTFKKFSVLFAIFLVMAFSGGISGLVETTVLRQRLPDVDSAAYYLVTRFSEIATFLAAALSFTIFPFAADKAADNVDLRPLIFKASSISAVFGALVALPFFIVGRQVLAILPHSEHYVAYWWAIPWQIGIATLGTFVGFYVTVQVSANRFGFLRWYAPLELAYASILLFVTGHAYFIGIIPPSWTEFLTTNNIHSLNVMLWWMTAINVIKAIGCLTDMLLHPSTS